MFEKDLDNLLLPDLCNKELFSLSGDATPVISSSLNNVQHIGGKFDMSPLCETELNNRGVSVRLS